MGEILLLESPEESGAASLGRRFSFLRNEFVLFGKLFLYLELSLLS